MSIKYYWLDYSQKDKWEESLSKFPDEKRDVYFDPEYVKLYEDGSRKAVCFIFVKDKSIFVYPFLQQAIQQAEGYFDICTPYGMGGLFILTKIPRF